MYIKVFLMTSYQSNTEGCKKDRMAKTPARTKVKRCEDLGRRGVLSTKVISMKGIKTKDMPENRLWQGFKRFLVNVRGGGKYGNYGTNKQKLILKQIELESSSGPGILVPSIPLPRNLAIEGGKKAAGPRQQRAGTIGPLRKWLSSLER